MLNNILHSTTSRCTLCTHNQSRLPCHGKSNTGAEMVRVGRVQVHASVSQHARICTQCTGSTCVPSTFHCIQCNACAQCALVDASPFVAVACSPPASDASSSPVADASPSVADASSSVSNVDVECENESFWQNNRTVVLIV